MHDGKAECNHVDFSAPCFNFYGMILLADNPRSTRSNHEI